MHADKAVLPLEGIKLALAQRGFIFVLSRGLVHLKGLTGLKVLDLRATRVTDDGLEHLKNLTGLEVLDVSRTQVADRGLEHLRGLANLKRLFVEQANFTKRALAALEQARPDLSLGLL